jgi:mRNA interferase MazF
VVSSDAYNDQPGALPHAVPIVRKSPGERPSQYVARLGETDPIAGVAVVNRLIRVHPSFAAQQVGILTGASMEMIGSTVRDLYELN